MVILAGLYLSTPFISSLIAAGRSLTLSEMDGLTMCDDLCVVITVNVVWVGRLPSRIRCAHMSSFISCALAAIYRQEGHLRLLPSSHAGLLSANASATS